MLYLCFSNPSDVKRSQSFCGHDFNSQQLTRQRSPSKTSSRAVSDVLSGAVQAMDRHPQHALSFFQAVSFGVFLFPYVLILIESSDALPFFWFKLLKGHALRVYPFFAHQPWNPATASFAFCIHFVHDLVCMCLGEHNLHALCAVAWCMHNSVPDDTPPTSVAMHYPPAWGSTYFLTPAAAEAPWPFLTAGERVSLQATEWWVHADLRWYIHGMAAIPDLLNRTPCAPAALDEPANACLVLLVGMATEPVRPLIQACFASAPGRACPDTVHYSLPKL